MANLISENRKRFAIGREPMGDGKFRELYWRFSISALSDDVAEAVQQIRERIPPEERVCLSRDGAFPWSWRVAANRRNLEALSDIFENFLDLRERKWRNIAAKLEAEYAARIRFKA